MSDAKIVSLHGATIIPGEADQDIVDLLASWLADAKRGELVAVSLVGIRPNDIIVSNARTGTKCTLLMGAMHGALAGLSQSWINVCAGAPLSEPGGDGDV